MSKENLLKEKRMAVNIPINKETMRKFKEQAAKKGMPVATWLRFLGLQDIARNDF